MFEASSGFISMPRKMSGSAMSTIDAFIAAIKTPIVVFDKAIHLYLGSVDPAPRWRGAIASCRDVGAVLAIRSSSCCGAVYLPGAQW